MVARQSRAQTHTLRTVAVSKHPPAFLPHFSAFVLCHTHAWTVQTPTGIVFPLQSGPY